MENLLDEMKFVLETDPTIRELVSFEVDEFTGIKFPSIAENESPQHFKMPYIVIRIESDLPESDDNTMMNRAILNFDVIGENKGSTVERIARRIEQLFDRRKLMPFGISSHREGVYPIESEDPSVIGKNVKLLVRYPREDLIEDETLAHSSEVLAFISVRKRGV